MSVILVVEDDVEAASALKGILEAGGHRVVGPAPDCSILFKPISDHSVQLAMRA